MAYHTGVYLFLFLPLTLAVYQLAPKKLRPGVLLLAGYIFFWMISQGLLLYLIGTTLFTHYIGIWIDWMKLRCGVETQGMERQDAKLYRERCKRKQKALLILAVTVLLGLLAYMKYYNFFVQNVNYIYEILGKTGTLTTKLIVLPIGISFYTLQAIGYLADVYWGKIPVEKNLGKVALFLGFFPQIMEGPIAMYGQTANQLWEGKSLTGDNLTAGAMRIVWGLFKKMIIADRLYVLVQAVFGHYQKYSGAVVACAAVAYTVQLYMEFSGSMDMIIGSGKMFGITLPENFRQPFTSKNPAEFWRRWHITLGAWFKAYIFYPVSTSGLVKRWNRFGKAHLSKYVTKLGVSALALFPVWFCNGLWHGARWSYLFYGMYYFTLLMLGMIVEPVRNRLLAVCHIREDSWYWTGVRIAKTWVIIVVGELFFRADGLRAGVRMFKSIFEGFDLKLLLDGTMLNFGLDRADYLAIGVGCAVVFTIGFIKERNLCGDRGIAGFRLPVRWALYYALILAVVIFGAYGIGYQQVDLIYAGF